MKKLLIVMFFLIFVFSSYAQKKYSVENLQNLSQKELNVYLKKAQNKKTAGAIISGAAAVVITSAFFIEDDSEPMGPPLPFVVGAGGVVIGLIGLPLLIKGSSRVKRIKQLQKTSLDNIKFDVQPLAQYNRISQKYQAGLTFRVTF